MNGVQRKQVKILAAETRIGSQRLHKQRVAVALVIKQLIGVIWSHEGRNINKKCNTLMLQGYFCLAHDMIHLQGVTVLARA